MLYQAHESFAEADNSGIFYVCVLILSKLSLDRNFAIALNKPFMNDLKFKELPLFVGSYADLLINVAINGIISNFEKRKYCFRMNYLCILSNVAPFLKNLHQITCAKMFHLLSVFSSAEFLMEEKDNYLALIKLIKILEILIIHQSDSNVNLMYEVLVRQKDILSIRKIKFEQLHLQNQQEQKRNASTKESHEEEKTENNGTVGQNGQPLEVGNIDWNEWARVVKEQLNLDAFVHIIKFLNYHLKLFLKEKAIDEEKVKGYLKEQTITGIYQMKGQIWVEAMKDSEGIRTFLRIFLWSQIYVKHAVLPYFDPQEIKFLNVARAIGT
jgi:hypothetical protein